MLQLGNFLTRHRRKFIICGIVVSGTFIALKYVQKKLIEMQERQAREFMERTRRTQHFESTEKTCNQVIISMGTELMKAIIKECKTDELIEQLRENPVNKVELWEEMKIVSFTRLTAFIYASSMLVVALRVQLNLLGGYLYRDTVSSQLGDQKNNQKISDNLKHQYLSLIRHFIQDDGLSKLVRLIRLKVISVVKQLPLTKRLSLADMEQLCWSLQMAINSDPNSDPCSKMCKFLLPSQISDYDQNDPILQKMFIETLDILESDDASSVCSNNICRGFSLALDAIAESISDTTILAQNSKTTLSTTNDDISASASTSTSTTENLPNINNVQTALAKIIPTISGLTSKGFDHSSRPQNLATSLITSYVVSEKCKILGANVYESFSSA